MQNYGYHSWFAVGDKRSSHSDVFRIPNDSYFNFWTRTWLKIASQIKASKIRGSWRIYQSLLWVARPYWRMKRAKGFEDFDFPGTWDMLDMVPAQPDIIHCHNLHGGYFDLRFLSQLSQNIPVLLTLHDAWLLSGHCAHSFECELWKTGCGKCPDLTIYPAIRRDETAYNWCAKREIYEKSRLFVSTPSQWLMDKVNNSILKSGIIESRVIPNGIDLEVFKPADRILAREGLGLPIKSKIILFAAQGIRDNIWKDYETMRTAIAKVAERWNGQEIVFLALGEDNATSERIGNAQIQFIPYQKDPAIVARFYQAADIYIHAARADTFPNTVLESLACGTPVVATAVGGIPEQIDDGQTGFLTLPGDPESMSIRIEQLLKNHDLHNSLGIEAAQVARVKFDLKLQIDNYLNWYYEILENHTSNSGIKNAIFNKR